MSTNCSFLCKHEQMTFVAQWTRYVKAATNFPGVLCSLILEYVGTDLKGVLIMMLTQSKNMEILLPIKTDIMGISHVIIKCEIAERRIDTITDMVKRETIVLTKQISVGTLRKARTYYKAPYIGKFWNDVDIRFLTKTRVFTKLGYYRFESDLVRFLSANWKGL